MSKTASPVEHFRQALQQVLDLFVVSRLCYECVKFDFHPTLKLFILRQGCEVSIKEVDILLALLAEKKRKMEQEEAERNMQILLDFLNCLRKQKVDELKEVCYVLYNFTPIYWFFI